MLTWNILRSFQVELETLNSATDEINKLEIELEEAIATFNILSNESTRRLKQLKGKLGNSCIEKSRPYYDAVEKARLSQIECQKAAVKFQRANGNLNEFIRIRKMNALICVCIGNYDLQRSYILHRLL